LHKGKFSLTSGKKAAAIEFSVAKIPKNNPFLELSSSYNFLWSSSIDE
jgi:hypothetical protein